MFSTEAAEVYFVDNHGLVWGSLSILARTAHSVIVLTDDEASERGEETVQVFEGHSYEYRLDTNTNAGLRLRDSSNPA